MNGESNVQKQMEVTSWLITVIKTISMIEAMDTRIPVSETSNAKTAMNISGAILGLTFKDRHSYR